MPRLTYIPATTTHAEELSLTLRPEDTAEVLACGFASGRESLLLSLERSDVAWAALVDGRVAAMFGLAQYPGTSAAVVWFLTGEEFLRHVRVFVKSAKATIGKLLAPHASLENHIDARYSAAVRWAKWLGFEVGEPVPFGPEGKLFHPALLRRS